MASKVLILCKLGILILLCNLNLKAQNKITSDSLIGDWIINGSVKQQVGDTIMLTKEIVNDKDYTKWIFKTNKEFIILGGQQGDKTHPSIGFKKIGGKWDYDEASRILKIDWSNYYNNYSNINYQANKIILIRIK
jgi:hypothetical protein